MLSVLQDDSHEPRGLEAELNAVKFRVHFLRESKKFPSEARSSNHSTLPPNSTRPPRMRFYQL